MFYKFTKDISIALFANKESGQIQINNNHTETVLMQESVTNAEVFMDEDEFFGDPLASYSETNGSRLFRPSTGSLLINSSRQVPTEATGSRIRPSTDDPSMEVHQQNSDVLKKPKTPRKTTTTPKSASRGQKTREVVDFEIVSLESPKRPICEDDDDDYDDLDGDVVDNRFSLPESINSKYGIRCSFCKRNFTKRKIFEMHLCTTNGRTMFQ